MYAYVTLVMLNDDYVQGAIVLAKSLKTSKTKHDLVCLVTSHVSHAAVQRLKLYYDHVKIVDVLHYVCPPMLTQRQDALYGKWINYSFTKWQCLTLLEYEKIIYLDADHLVIKNIDELFEMNTPSMCFCADYHKYYEQYRHNDVISVDELRHFLYNNKILGRSGTVVLKPDMMLYNSILSQLNTKNDLLKKNRFHNGYDEQVFLQALIASNMSVTQLSVMYVWNAGAYDKIKKYNEPSVINYYGDKKPWHYGDNDNITYMDVYIWRYFNQL